MNEPEHQRDGHGEQSQNDRNRQRRLQDVVHAPPLVDHARAEVPLHHLQRVVAEKFVPVVGMKLLGQLLFDDRIDIALVRKWRPWRHPRQQKRDEVNHRQDERKLHDSPEDELGHNECAWRR